MINCVIRTYRAGFTITISNLSKKLNEGWIVKSSTPFVDKTGRTECVEYILEKEE